MWGSVLELRRRLLRRRAPAGPLGDYLATPFPDGRRDWREVEFVAVDLETTGLDPGSGAIVSVGLVRLHAGCVALGTARHWLVRQEAAMPEAAAVIHGITDDRAAAGLPLADVLTDVLGTLRGRVMIAHHARLETGFLRAACRQVYGADLIVPTIDTEVLERVWRDRRHQPYGPGDLRLDALRRSYGLPAYRAHDALADALGAAELFLAHLAHRGPASGTPLRDLLAWV